MSLTSIGDVRIPSHSTRSMHLPPELISRILKYLSDDPQSLKVMSLVSKAWTAWCQTHLFKSIHLKPSTLQRWLKDVSPGADSPASHTRTLTLEEYRLIPWINPHGRCVDFPPSALSSFSNTRSLSLIRWNATLFNGASPEPYFGHFSKSLRTLSLQFCTLDLTILFDFLSLLPNVDDLDIVHPCLDLNTLATIPNIPEATPGFRGTLSLTNIRSEHLILKALAALPLRFSTVKITDCIFYEHDLYQTLFTGCRDTLVTLRFEQSHWALAVPDVSLASCTMLEEIYVLFRSFKRPSRSFRNLLSSVTSPRLRKISLSFMDPIDDDSDLDSESDDEDEIYDSDGADPRNSFDATLSQLAKRVSKIEGKLTLQLNVHRIGSQPFDFDPHFHQFLKYGALEINYTQA